MGGFQESYQEEMSFLVAEIADLNGFLDSARSLSCRFENVNYLSSVFGVHFRPDEIGDIEINIRDCYIEGYVRFLEERSFHQGTVHLPFVIRNSERELREKMNRAIGRSKEILRPSEKTMEFILERAAYYEQVALEYRKKSNGYQADYFRELSENLLEEAAEIEEKIAKEVVL